MRRPATGSTTSSTSPPDNIKKQITTRFIAVALLLGLLVPSAISQDSKDTKKPTVIIGSTFDGVEELLKGWTIRKSNRSTASRPIVYYIKDVEIIVSYEGGKAVGVAVIDKPGSGISPIPKKRFNELVSLIGGGQPKARDIRRDESGIREFSVGDAD